MRFSRLRPRLQLLLPLALVACGSRPETDGDPFRGAVDASALDARLLPSSDKKLCPSGPCYPGQQGWARGQRVFFYNLGTAPSVGDGAAPTVFEPSGCDADFEFDPVRDAYPREVQWPVFSSLPLATSPALPLYTRRPVDGVGTACNDLKDARSVTAEGGDAELVLLAPIDPAASLRPGDPSLRVEAKPAWFRGLALSYLEGGKVPTDAAGKPVAMDGVLLSPLSPAPPSRPTEPGAVLLPRLPGEPGWSPIVRLHPYASERGPGSFTGVCAAPPCEASEVDLSQTSAPTSVLFLVAGAP